MSYKAQQWALEQTDVFGLDKWVLFILAYRDNHDEPHGCWPSQNRMALDCGIARSSINRALTNLEKLGKIKREQRLDPSGDPDTTYYTFPQVWVVPIRDKGSPRKRKRVVPGGDTNKHTTTNNEQSAQTPRAASQVGLDRSIYKNGY